MALFLILISPAVGSFLALLSDRLPRGEDVVFKASACRTCQTSLSVADLIPILSYLTLRGYCRHCSAAIPRWLPLMEIAALGLAIGAALVAETDLQLLLGCGFLWTLLALFACDFKWFRLPNGLTAALLVLGLALAWEDPGRNLIGALGTAAAGSGVFLAVRIAYRRLRGREGLGLGDVKLMAGFGAAFGVTLLPTVVLVAALLALASELIRARWTGEALHGDRSLPFGSFLTAAAALVWLLT